MGVGPGRQSRPRLGSAEPGDAAGDPEPAGRHGRTARDEADRPVPCDRLGRRSRTGVDRSPSPAPARAVGERRSRVDHRHGVRQRRRRRGGRSLGRRRHDVARRTGDDRSGVTNGSPARPGPSPSAAARVDDSGNRETPGAGIVVSVVPNSCPCPTLWTPATLPAVVDADDPSPVELGLKFRTDVPGIITGVRFYKSPSNTRHAHRQLVDEHRHVAGPEGFRRRRP